MVVIDGSKPAMATTNRISGSTLEVTTEK